jgi:hypothetical protein
MQASSAARITSALLKMPMKQGFSDHPLFASARRARRCSALRALTAKVATRR